MSGVFGYLSGSPPEPTLAVVRRRTDLRAWAEGILFDPRARQRGLFDPDTVRALWERHLRGQKLWTIGKIAPLMTIELVLRGLIDDDPSAWVVASGDPVRGPG